MQTDRGIYHKRVCDRCGAVLGGRMMNPDEYFKDWAWRRDTGDLCPECYEVFDRKSLLNANLTMGTEKEEENEYSTD